MRLVLMIAGGILLAFCLLPFLGVIGALLLCVLVIGVAIYSLTYTGTKIVEFKKNIDDGAKEHKAEREERKKWLESLPKDERNAQIKAQRKKEIKETLQVTLILFVLFGIPIIIFIFLLHIP